MSSRVSSFAVEVVFNAIGTREEGIDRTELQQVSGYSQAPVHAATVKLLEQKRIHIVAWRNYRMPVFVQGDGPNAPRPKVMSAKARQRKYQKVNHAIITARRRKKDGTIGGTGHWTIASPKGLFYRGTNHYRASITEEQARLIKSRLKTGESLQSIAAAVGCTKGTVYCIKVGKSWAWV